MRIRFLLTMLLLLLATFSLFAQQQGQRRATFRQMLQGKITGRVLDAETRQPLEAVAVAVYRMRDSSLVTGSITNPEGRFSIEGLPPGRFCLHVSFIGYKKLNVSGIILRPGSWEADVGDILLEPETEMLQEVQVTGEREFVEVKPDRMVYNIKEMPVVSGGNAAEVLQNVPSLQVDEFQGTISLRGNENVVIFLNGRPFPLRGEALINFLQNLPANAVERVEVIPNPSARYDPEGMAGIVNIVLRQNRDLGIGGGLSLGAATGNIYNASGNLNYQKGPWNLFGNYAFRQSQRNSDGWRVQTIGSNFLDQNNFSKRTNHSNSLNGTLEYRLNRLTTLSLQSFANYRQNTGNERSEYIERNVLGEKHYLRFDEEAGHSGTLDQTLALRRIVQPSRNELIIEARYNTNWSSDTERFWNQFKDSTGQWVEDPLSRQRNESNNRTTNASIQLDYIRPLGRNGKIELGYKTTFRRLDYTLDIFQYTTTLSGYVRNTFRSDDFVYDELFHAAYGIVEREWGSLSMQVGLRAEQTYTRFNQQRLDASFRNRYLSLFPSVFVAYKLSDRNQLRLSYSKRIRRPRARQLNPIDTNEDPTFRRIGNPYLEPEYTHAVELSYSSFLPGATLTLTPYFRRRTNVFGFYQYLDVDSTTVFTFRNFDKSDSYGGEFIGTYRLGDRLSGFVNFNLFRYVTDASNVEEGLGSSDITWFGRINTNIRLSPILDIQLSYFYRAPREIEGGRISAFTRGDIGLRAKLFNEQVNLSIRLSDPFNTMGFQMQRNLGGTNLQMRRKFDSRRLYVTLSWNFGNQSSRRRQRTRGERPQEENPESFIF